MIYKYKTLLKDMGYGTVFVDINEYCVTYIVLFSPILNSFNSIASSLADLENLPHICYTFEN